MPDAESCPPPLDDPAPRMVYFPYSPRRKKRPGVPFCVIASAGANNPAKVRLPLMADNSATANPGDEPKKKPMPAVPGASAMKGSPTEFLKDSWIEVTKKTTWPTRQELLKSTSVVLAAILAISFYLATWDLLMTRLTMKIFTR
jgi:preprotein translocase SecE subunit